jgi:sialate O-acetylesterase
MNTITKPTSFFASCLLSLIVGAALHAEVKVANIFGDNMVLQRDKPLNIFGTAEPGEEVQVALKGQTETATAGDKGRWLVKLKPVQVGDPFEVRIKGASNEVVLKNVLAGEVWICSGQSNMEWTVAGAGNPQQEIAAANWPQIRHVKINNTTSMTPKSEAGNTGWQICSPSTAGSFTAVGYYFARHLHQEIGVPIGLINTSWGGTIVETWISSESLSENKDFAARILEMRKNQDKNSKLAKQYEDKTKAWLAERDKKMSPLLKQMEAWKGEVDESQWASSTLPGVFAGEMESLDGIVWYRKTVEVPVAWESKSAVLSLGQIDDNDVTFVNGEKVGETRGWTADRNYTIQSIKPGKLTIAVQVTDPNGQGGFHSNADTMHLSVEGQDPISLAGEWKMKVGVDFSDIPPRPRNPAVSGPNHPTLLHNAMVNPIIPVTFRGAVWYQGESNAGRAFQYRELFPLLINDWRKKWGEEFPFYWVQLANFTAPASEPGPSTWAELREAQSMTLRLKKTGQAVIIDIGEARDIHPKNKQDVGKRLALHALAKDYGREDLVYSGPQFRRAVPERGRVRVSFDHVGSGLMIKGEELKRFEVAGEDGQFVWADGLKIDYNEVLVSSSKIKNPMFVRYAWADNPEGCNLFNREGLPASPFRSDEIPGATAPQK